MPLKAKVTAFDYAEGVQSRGSHENVPNRR